MVATLSADHDPPEDARVDILDTAEAGPSVIRGSLLRLSAYLLGTLATLASSAVVIRHLGVVDTGRFITVTAIVTIVATISDLGLTSIAVREYAARPRPEGRRFLRNLLGVRVVFALGGLLVAVLFGLVIGYPSVMVVGIVIAGLGMVGVVLQDGVSIPLQVGLRFGWVSGLQLAIQVGAAIEAVLLVVAGAGLVPFFALQLPVVLPVLAVTAVVGGHDARLLPSFDTQEWRRMVGRILPYSATVVLAVVYFQIAQVMVSLLSSPTETGYFGVAFRVLVSCTLLPGLVMSPALPLLARAARDDAARFDYASRRLAETMLLSGCGCALALFLGARFAVDVVAGPGFGHSVEVLRILAVALLGTFVTGGRGYALLSLDRLRAMLVSNGIALIVVVACGVPLISADGATGAAIARLAAELTLAGGYEWALSRSRPAVRFGLRFVLKAATAALIAAAVTTALGVPSVVAAALGLALYVALVLALGIVPVEVRQALRDRRRPGA